MAGPLECLSFAPGPGARGRNRASNDPLMLKPGTRPASGVAQCASALREAMWSMVSETRSEIDFDYVAYTGENLDRFERAWEAVA